MLGTCSTAAGTFSCRIGGLTSGTAVYVDVLATNANGRGAASTPRVGVTLSLAAGLARGVTVLAQPRQLMVLWVQPEDDGGTPITGYLVRAWNSPTGGTPVASCATNGSTICGMNRLDRGTTYYVDVAVRTAEGVSPTATARIAAKTR